MLCGVCFFFEDTATTEIDTYLHTLSLHDALPISPWRSARCALAGSPRASPDCRRNRTGAASQRQAARQIGRAHVCTTVTNDPLVSRTLLEQKNPAYHPANPLTITNLEPLIDMTCTVGV